MLNREDLRNYLIVFARRCQESNTPVCGHRTFRQLARQVLREVAFSPPVEVRSRPVSYRAQIALIFTPDVLKRLRRHYGFRMASMAERLDTSQVTWSRWERGLSVPSLAAAHRIYAMLPPAFIITARAFEKFITELELWID